MDCCGAKYHWSVHVLFVSDNLVVLQATLGFFTLPPETVGVTNSLLSSLTTLLCAILLTRWALMNTKVQSWSSFMCKTQSYQTHVLCIFETYWGQVLWNGSGEDGKSRADQLQHLLKNLDQYMSSPAEYERQRACHTVVALLKQFQALCTSGICPFNCTGNCMHLRSTTERGQSSSTGDIQRFLCATFEEILFVVAYTLYCEFSC